MTFFTVRTLLLAECQLPSRKQFHLYVYRSNCPEVL